MVGDNLQGKYFIITDPINISTVIYQVNKTGREFVKNAPKYTVERLEYSEEIIVEKKKKTFFVKNPAPEGNLLLILSCSTQKVIINMGFLDYNVIRISKKPMPIKYKTIYNEEEFEFKEFAYTPNMQRSISIIDPENGEEIKPILYFDEETNEVKGKCKLKPYKKYFAFEIKEIKD